MSKLDGKRRQRKCFSHYESMINGSKSPKHDCMESFTVYTYSDCIVLVQADTADAGDHKGDEGGNLVSEVSPEIWSWAVL